MRRMPGQLDSLKSRKRKSSAEMKTSRKVYASRRKCVKSPKSCSAAESSSAVGSLERLSRISCECHQSAGSRRCSASPELHGQDGKENELRPGLEVDGCGLNDAHDKQDPEVMDYDETSKTIFPDDDSNQILPVEQFFGNMDAVQDFPQRPSPTSARVPRENRRRHYYAPEDSDEDEVGLSSTVTQEVLSAQQLHCSSVCGRTEKLSAAK